ncbi:MAG: ABC transporter substrate-binding protein [Oligoflexia bacterium]|nr:ABC transporter substrate-binding protein [Oligoflexia bacterium]
MSKQRVEGCLIVVLAMLWLLLAGPACAEDKIKIGAILPLTGDMAAVGAACRDAIRLAMEEAAPNSHLQYEVLFEDDHLTPTEVAKASEKLLSVDKVNAIISTWSYGGRIVAPKAEKARIPHIGVAWDHLVADGEYSFLHLTPPSEFMSKFLEVFKRLGVKKVALLGVEESGSVFALDEFIRMAPEYGVQVVFRDSVMWDLNDFNPLVSRITRLQPDYLVFNAGGESLTTRLLQAIKNQHVKYKVTAITAFDTLQDTSLIEGRWYVSDSFLPEEFAQRFEKRFGHKIRYGVGNFYEAARLLVNAFESAGANEPQKARNYLASVKDEPSIFGSTSVSEKGIFRYPAQLVRILGGKRTLISESDIVE